jgi:hypothetical protein
VSYWPKALIGGALFLGSVVLFNVKLLDLLQVGTCASGGPYVSARPCPPGTGTDMLLLMASIFGGLIGAWIFALRGKRPGGSGRGGGGFSDGLLAWSVYFVGTGGYALYSVLTDDSLESGATTGGLIVAGTFLLMGLPALVALIWLWVIHRNDEPVDDRFSPSTPQSLVSQLAAARSAARGWAPAPAPVQPAATPNAGPDPIAQLERLQRLRESGALTEAEFAAQKRRVLGS